VGLADQARFVPVGPPYDYEHAYPPTKLRSMPARRLTLFSSFLAAA